MPSAVEDVALAEYRDLIELNLIAPLRLIQVAVPLMRTPGGGPIVNISSQASTKHIPHIAGYASATSALDAPSRTARADLDQCGANKDPVAAAGRPEPVGRP